MKLSVCDVNGKELRKLDVDETVFGIEPNAAVLHQAFVIQRNNQRWGTAQTKTRGEVQGSTRKIRRQKYTGAARQGGIRSPTRVGGGIAFGPVQRDYSQAFPKKMRRLAIRSALSGKVADGELIIVDQLAFEKPKTKEIIRILRNVGIERSALIVTEGPERNVLTSARNLQKTKVLPAAYLNVVDMLNHRSLLMTEEAIKVAEGLWGRKQTPPVKAAEVPPKRRRGAKAEAVPEPEPEAMAVEEAKASVETPKTKPRVKRAAAAARAAPEQPKAAAKPKPVAKPKAIAKPKAPPKPKAAAKAPAKETKATAEPKVTARKPAAKPAAKKEPDAEAPKPRRRAKKADGGES